MAGASKYHFARCFEATYGETPIRDLTRRRIERAQDLLRAANLTVTEVCITGRGLPWVTVKRSNQPQLEDFGQPGDPVADRSPFSLFEPGFSTAVLQVRWL